MKKSTLSIILKIIATISSIVGVCIVAFFSKSAFMGGTHSLMYFTILSNIFLAVVEILVLCFRKNNAVGLLYYLAAVSITLTFVVFCTMLAPFLPNAWNLSNTLTHVIAPVAAIVDYLLLDDSIRPEKKHVPLSTIPPLCYLGFTIVAYALRLEFTPGKFYPYTFLNYGGSAGIFGFSTNVEDSLFLGSFYWVVILILFVLGIAALYRKIHNARMRASD